MGGSLQKALRARSRLPHLLNNDWANFSRTYTQNSAEDGYSVRVQRDRSIEVLTQRTLPEAEQFSQRLLCPGRTALFARLLPFLESLFEGCCLSKLIRGKLFCCHAANDISATH